MATAGVQITLDRPRVLKLTFNELIGLEQRLGKPSGEIFSDVSKLSMGTLQAVMFACLRHEDPRLKMQTVNGMIEDYLDDDHDLGDLLMLVNEVVTQSGLFGRGAGKKEESAGSS